MKTCQQAAIDYNKRLLEGLRLTHQVQQGRDLQQSYTYASCVSLLMLPAAKQDTAAS